MHRKTNEYHIRKLSKSEFMKRILLSFMIFSLVVVSLTPSVMATSHGRDLLRNRDTLRERVRERIASYPAWLRLLRSGHVALTNGELTAINGTSLTVSKENKSYTVLTDDKTQVRRKFWGKSELAEFSIGDKLNVVGTWTDETQTTIQARLIRNLSIQRRHGVFFGTVTSKTDTGFITDTIRRGNQTVIVDSETEYVNRRQESIGFADIAVGHRVRIRGLWDSTLSKITEVSQIKDFSIPPRSSPAASP